MEQIRTRLGDAAVAWVPDGFSGSLARYAVRHGVAHLLELRRHSDALSRLCDLRFFAALLGESDRWTAALNLWRALGEREPVRRYVQVLGAGPIDGLLDELEAWLGFVAEAEWTGHLALARRLLERREALLGPTDFKTLSARLAFAKALHDHREWEEAESALRRVVADASRQLGPHHETTRSATLRLAALLADRQQLDDAEALLNGLIGTGASAEARNVLAVVWQSQGRLAEAESLFREVAAETERELGPQHPNSLIARGNVAGILRLRGASELAATEYEGVVAQLERQVGREYASTRTARNNLALAWQDLGRLEDAERMLREVLEDESLSGQAELGSATRNNLAGLLHAKGELAESEAMLRTLLEQTLSIFGPCHEATLTVRNNIGQLLVEQERTEEATVELRELLTDCERNLGAEHPDTVTTRGNLGSLLDDTGHEEEAEPLLRRAFASKKAQLGLSHPQTSALRARLAGNLMSLGYLDEAEELLRGAAAVPGVLDSQAQLALALRKQADRESEAGRFEQARARLREAVDLLRGVVAHEAGESLRFALCDVLEELAEVEFELERPEEARALLCESLVVRTTLAEEEPTRRWARAMTLDRLSILEAHLGNHQAACALAGESLAVQRDESTVPQDASRTHQLTVTALRLAQLESAWGDGAAARMLTDEAVELRRRLAEQQPEDFEVCRGLGYGITVAGCLALDDGRYADALRLLEEALALRQELHEQDLGDEVLLDLLEACALVGRSRRLAGDSSGAHAASAALHELAEPLGLHANAEVLGRLLGRAVERTRTVVAHALRDELAALRTGH